MNLLLNCNETYDPAERFLFDNKFDNKFTKYKPSQKKPNEISD